LVLLIHLLNISPHHPSTHGVLRLIALLHGEIIYHIIIEIGLLHRGTEKLVEANSSYINVPYFDRLDYVSTITQEHLFIATFEILINVTIIPIISFWRIILSELYRNLNHCLNITTHAIDIGVFSTMIWLFEEREKLINLIEGLTGTRFHNALLLIGRLRYNISLVWIDSFLCWLAYFIIKIKEIHTILGNNRIWRTRLYEIGIIKKDNCLFYGITGIIARSTNLRIDARLCGYEFYVGLSYLLFLCVSGDCLSRYILRVNEIMEGNKIVYIILSLLFV